MARKYKQENRYGSKILLIDDNLEYLEATKMLLQRDGHDVTTASSGIEALDKVKQQNFDLVLVDYYMPGMTGEEFIAELRKFNEIMQVILQTGYASEHPPRELLRRLEIQGYFDKSEGPNKLLLWVDVGLKAAKTIKFINRSRESLNYILNVTPDLHKIQPLDELLKGILIQVMGLLGVGNSFLAVFNLNRQLLQADEDHKDSFLAMVDEDLGLIVQSGTGHFKEKKSIQKYLPSDKIEIIKKSLQDGNIKIMERSTILPLRVGDYNVGVIYIDQEIEDEQELELLKIFANQAAVAIHNSRLYQVATTDVLTSVLVRGFFHQCLIRELRTAFRNNYNMAVLMIDVDNLKTINDRNGHLAGDQALILLGQALRKATRSTDFIGRYGGDEFSVLLPQSDEKAALIVVARILGFLNDNPLEIGGLRIQVQCSIGAGVLGVPSFDTSKMPRPIPQTYFQKMAEHFIEHTDQALYKAKAAGKNRYEVNSEKTAWLYNAD